jgi:NADH dehydrogenase (ubiquinone) Fe-S protein 1
MNFNIVIDKKIVVVNSNMTILQACESANIIVPKFCYHERLSIAGNCRMCLVEIDKAPKLVASCAMPALQNMVIHTNSLAVKKAREGVLEFLLINHPLDCGICDQAGECDLQEQSKGFGSDRGRFQENKRAVQDFECGPLIKTIMTRCIHCTRCVRFANEIIGLPDLGTSGRGGSLEINLYIKKLFKSEFSGNLIDLCPVGALTSKPYTFLARSWELKSIESIDVLDGIGSNIRLDTRGYELMRILPRLNENINEEWISDKTRFAFDGLRQQRLYEPLAKNSYNKFEIITWKEAINLVLQNLNKIKLPYQLSGLIGPQADFETIFLLNYLINKYNGNFVDFENSNFSCVDFKTSYLFNSNFKNIDNSDICLLIGVNPRIEGAILNLRLRKRYLAGNFKVASFGSFFDVSFPVYNLGSTLSNLLQFVEGRHLFSKYFSRAKTPLIIIGQAFFETVGEKQAWALINLIVKNTYLLRKTWCGVNILNNKASDTGKYEIGIKANPLREYKASMLYVIGEGKIKRFTPSTFIIYQGYQANNTTNLANLILPGKAFTEKISTFLNTEGRYQLTKTATSSPTSSKEDWSILYAILEKSNLISFIKAQSNVDFLAPKLIDIKTFFQRIEMDPFYEENLNFQPVVIELNLYDVNLILPLLNYFKDLNYSFDAQSFLLDKTNLKTLGKISVLYSDLYDLYLHAFDVIEDLIKAKNHFAIYALETMSQVQNNLFIYPSIFKNESFLRFFISPIESMEKAFKRYKYNSCIITSNISELELHCMFILKYATSFYPVFFHCLVEVDFYFGNKKLYHSFKMSLEALKEVDFKVEIKSFLTFLSKFLKIFSNKKKTKHYIFTEFFYACLNFYKNAFFFNNDFFTRYKTIFSLVEFVGVIPTLQGYSFISRKLKIDLFEPFNRKKLIRVSRKVEKKLNFFIKDNFEIFYYENNIYFKLNNIKNFISIDDIKSLYIYLEDYNNSVYKSEFLKTIAFSKFLKNTSILKNKILPASNIDNFYLMDDFSKFSILMKHCSDTFLERSPFKK